MCHSTWQYSHGDETSVFQDRWWCNVCGGGLIVCSMWGLPLCSHTCRCSWYHGSVQCDPATATASRYVYNGKSFLLTVQKGVLLWCCFGGETSCAFNWLVQCELGVGSPGVPVLFYHSLYIVDIFHTLSHGPFCMLIPCSVSKHTIYIYIYIYRSCRVSMLPDTSML